MSISWLGFKSLGVAIGSVIAFSGSSSVAQVLPDNTLTTNSQVQIQGNIITIKGGTTSGNNLFHSFKDFTVPNESTAEFINAENIQNIISRVTGNLVSNIYGTLKAQHTANLFLINPNGIIFGPNASLQIGGSFVASTANSLIFADRTQFSAIDPQTTPLLTVSVPVGLQFGATAAPIRNQSQASPGGAINISYAPVGLQVGTGKTLALVGGDITLEGGNLTAPSGRIELGSVSGNSFVKLNPTNQGWSLEYKGVQEFQNIQLIQRTELGSANNIPSIVDASGNGGGNIHLQGKFIELTGNKTLLTTQTTGDRDSGDLTITGRKLIVQDGAQVSTATTGQGLGGNLTINIDDSVEVIGSAIDPDTGYDQPSILSSLTGATGKAGDITINTGRLRILDGGRVSTESSGMLVLQDGFQLMPATGGGGNLTVNASDSVEIMGISKYGTTGGLIALTNSSGNAGTVTITTGKLTVRDQAAIAVNSQFSTFRYLGGAPNLGRAGELSVNARSILLDNKAQLISENESGQSGNITLNVQDLLLMRHQSQITTNAGTRQAGGDGGNITINAPSGFLVTVPSENNDITANAFSGSGGKVTINAKSIFGFVPRTRADLVRLLNTSDPKQLNPSKVKTSDITAFSQQNPSLNGTVQINSPDVDPSKGLVELPVNVVDASQQIVADCNSGGKTGRSSFIATGRGGVVADPTEPLIADDAVVVDWITLSPESKNRAEGRKNRVVVQKQRNTEEKSQKVNSVNVPTEIVEAQGWVIDANGNVVLVAQAPNARPNSPTLATASCAAH
nr:filamentous hemagglutinin N-terminal domain-containing protein [Nostoc sp. ChiQUE02]MDZ8234452.1 filamentous hemagglutinin N-terminal domain-containing protein [Nostoc sp. ChiQUE02]